MLSGWTVKPMTTGEMGVESDWSWGGGWTSMRRGWGVVPLTVTRRFFRGEGGGLLPSGSGDSSLTRGLDMGSVSGE